MMKYRYQSESKENPPFFPEVIEAPVLWGDINLQRANDHKAIVNPETGKVFSIVSKDYKLIRHEDAVLRVNNVIDENSDLGKYKVSTEFYNDGSRMRSTYCFYEISTKITPGDPVNPELHLFNSYDTSWPFIVLLGAFRSVCANGLVVGRKFLYIRKRHVYDFDQIDLEEQISTVLKRFRFQTNQWRKWADRQLTERDHKKIIKSMKWGKGAIEEIEARTADEARDVNDRGFPIISLWIFYNVITWYITHRAVSLNHRIEMERRLRTALRGF
jgi:hypothetical protein